MSLYQDILSGKEKLSLVGLGYVGMPIAVAFSRKIKVVGFDLNAAKIDLYKSGVDPTKEVGDEVIRNTKVSSPLTRQSCGRRSSISWLFRRRSMTTIRRI